MAAAQGAGGAADAGCGRAGPRHAQRLRLGLLHLLVTRDGAGKQSPASLGLSEVPAICVRRLDSVGCFHWVQPWLGSASVHAPSPRRRSPRQQSCRVCQTASKRPRLPSKGPRLGTGAFADAPQCHCSLNESSRPGKAACPFAVVIPGYMCPQSPSYSSFDWN